MRAKAIVLIIATLLAAAWKSGRKPEPYRFPVLAYFPPMPVAADNPVTVEGADLGRHLFYDSILSFNKRFSCASCHRQEAAFSDGPATFSRGIDGHLLQRNTPPLFNLAWYPAFFWDGRAVSLEEQVFHPVRAHEEMNLRWPVAVRRVAASPFYQAKFRAAFGTADPDSILIAKAIAQFERILLSGNSRFDQVLQGKAVFTPDEYKGFELANDMAKGGCLHCHSSDADALGVVPGFSNNGLDAASDAAGYRDKGRGAVSKDPADNGKFKTPSLRNLEFTPPYMHDGRFQTLEEVLRFYSEEVRTGVNTDAKMEYAHQGGARLSSEEQARIIAFLRTMTDSSFISDKRYSNPFQAGRP